MSDLFMGCALCGSGVGFMEVEESYHRAWCINDDCGVQLTAVSREELIRKWNRRSSDRRSSEGERCYNEAAGHSNNL